MTNFVYNPTTTYGSILDLMFIKYRDYKKTIKVLPIYYSEYDCVKLSLTYEEPLVI